MTGRAPRDSEDSRPRNTIPAALAPTATYPNLCRTILAALALAALGLLAFAGVASADLLRPRSRAARRTPTTSTRSTRSCSYSRSSSSSASRASLIYSLVKYRHRKGRGRRPDPRQHAARDRLDGRRRADPVVVLDGRHLRLPAGDIQNPPTSERQRLRRPGRRAASVRRRPRTASRPNGRRAEHRGQRPAVRLALHVPDGDDNADNVFAYTEMVVPVGHDRHARHHGPGRHPLLVDPEARRQVRRRARATRTSTWFKIPGDKAGQLSSRASAPSCAGATTRTCSPRCARSRPDEFKRWFAGKKRAIKAANATSIEQRKALATRGPGRRLASTRLGRARMAA